MQLNPSMRMTAHDALNHPWVKREAANVKHMEVAQSKLKILNNNRKMKVLLLCVCYLNYRWTYVCTVKPLY